MIVKMKKVSLVVLDSSREESLRKLRETGVVHLEMERIQNERISELEEKHGLLERALLLLSAAVKVKDSQGKDRRGSGDKGKEKTDSGLGTEEALASARRIIELVDQQHNLGEELSRLERKRSALAEWGDFNPADIVKLEENGVFMRLYTLTRDEFNALPENLAAFPVQETKRLVRIAIVSLGAGAEISGTEFPLPSKGLRELDTEAQKIAAEIERTGGQLVALAAKAPEIRRVINELNVVIEFEQVRAGMETEGPLAYLTGYVPQDLVAELEGEAASEGWAMLTEEPTEADPVPTLVRNPQWIRIIRPVFDFLGTIPGYREYDISFWFLLFLSIFFAMLIGDGGYGTLFLIVCIAARIKLKKAPPEPFFLLFVFSACTMAWGAITGTWFGARSLVAPHSPLSRLIIDSIATFPEGSYDSSYMIKYICFLMGAIHISIAHIKSFMRNLPRLSSFAQLGWLSIVWGAYFIVQIIVLGRDADSPVLKAVPNLTLMTSFFIFVVAGLGLVIVFGEQKGKFLKGLASGLAYLPLRLLDGIGTFSDIVSYVRLFAVGLASVEVAAAFNNMAGGLGFGFPMAFGAALILFFGHALNIVMGALSIIVHGVRLNVLEFSTHLGMEWSGIPYRPFSLVKDGKDGKS